MLAGAGYASGLITQDHAIMVFCAAFFLSKLLGGSAGADAEKLVGQPAPDVQLTNIATGKPESLADYIKTGLPTMIDFYQSF